MSKDRARHGCRLQPDERFGARSRREGGSTLSSPESATRHKVTWLMPALLDARAVQVRFDRTAKGQGW